MAEFDALRSDLIDFLLPAGVSDTMITQDTNLIEERILDSMRFMDVVMLLNEFIGAAISKRVTLDDLTTLSSIENFCRKEMS